MSASESFRSEAFSTIEHPTVLKQGPKASISATKGQGGSMSRVYGQEGRVLVRKWVALGVCIMVCESARAIIYLV
jgi:hypothetical protein